MREGLSACWKDREVADLGRLFAGLLLVACVWALAGCTIPDGAIAETDNKPSIQQYVKEIILSDGVRCVVYGESQGFGGGGISCDWRCPQ